MVLQVALMFFNHMVKYVCTCICDEQGNNSLIHIFYPSITLQPKAVYRILRYKSEEGTRLYK